MKIGDYYLHNEKDQVIQLENYAPSYPPLKLGETDKERADSWLLCVWNKGEWDRAINVLSGEEIFAEYTRLSEEKWEEMKKEGFLDWKKK